MAGKRAYLVLGPESSGTRLVTRLLVEAGCFGEYNTWQRFDSALPTNETPIVWRRSFPHGVGWPNIDGLVRQLRQRGYIVRAIVLTRDWEPMLRSQVATHRPATLQEAEAAVRAAYALILEGLGQTNIAWRLVSYEALVHAPSVTAASVCGWCGLPTPRELPEIRDENAKWYADA